jgi:hypothetical protein
MFLFNVDLESSAAKDSYSRSESYLRPPIELGSITLMALNPNCTKHSLIPILLFHNNYYA